MGGRGGGKGSFEIRREKHGEMEEKGARTSAANGCTLTTTERPARNRHFRFTQISSFSNKLVLCCSEGKTKPNRGCEWTKRKALPLEMVRRSPSTPPPPLSLAATSRSTCSLWRYNNIDKSVRVSSSLLTSRGLMRGWRKETRILPRERVPCLGSLACEFASWIGWIELYSWSTWETVPAKGVILVTESK